MWLARARGAPTEHVPLGWGAEPAGWGGESSLGLIAFMQDAPLEQPQNCDYLQDQKWGHKQSSMF